ncbi:hypothetical protein B9Z19DRAFT_1125137 [Tuber borchii]|uniref:Uncharacterized protein n=1 Tax=Tuber borchii TaxID=42251 RepID=A0A2T6ZVH4_TUBBO|nr:hypothetical protein B9Z19DRAFT_1125137 [Tuber borchii]
MFYRPIESSEGGGVENAIAKRLYNGVLRYLICPPPKGCPHMSIFHYATESSEGEVLMLGDSGGVRYAIMDPFNDGGLYHPICPPPKRAVTLVPDSQSFRHAMTEAIYDVVLHSHICLQAKGRLYTRIIHGATASSDGGVIMPGYLESNNLVPDS